MPIPLEEAAKSHEILESMNGGGSLIRQTLSVGVAILFIIDRF